MKYSNYIGIAAAVVLIALCFFPWVYISAISTTLTGLYTPNTNFGKPGLMNIIMAVISIALFIIPAIWAKRLNLFIGAFNLAWAVRNYLLITQCQLGECPEKKMAIYAIVFVSAIMLLMALLPKVNLQQNTNTE